MATAPKKDKPAGGKGGPAGAGKAARTPGAKASPAGAKEDRASRVAPVKNKELVEQVTAATGLRKGDVKIIVEATLRAIRASLEGGKEIVANPLGKIKVTREKDAPNGRVLICRVKLLDEIKAPKTRALAEDGEDD